MLLWFAGVDLTGPLVIGSLLIFLLYPFLVIQSLSFKVKSSAYRGNTFSTNLPFWKAFEVFFYFFNNWHKQQTYLMEKTRFGNTRLQIGEFDDDTNKSGFGIYSIVLAAVGGIFLFLELDQEYGFSEDYLSEIISFHYMFAGVILFWVVLCDSYRSAFTIARYMHNVCIGPVRIKVSIDNNEYTWLAIRNLFLCIITLGLYTPWAKVRSTRYILEHVKVIASGSLDDFFSDVREESGELQRGSTQQGGFEISL
jgi:uncharacterized membrane protein YjgN (DUF898 family)